VCAEDDIMAARESPATLRNNIGVYVMLDINLSQLLGPHSRFAEA
jgi:hypothetical protein